MPENSKGKTYDCAMSLEAGQTFAGYTILRVLGTGGMGQVYLATHPRLPREDALKVLPPDLTDDPEYRARFEREAELAAGLSHPHIVRIHDRGEQDGQFWISMDYVAGTDVGRLSAEHYPGGMPLEEVVSIITAVASALDYAHHRGLLHRDIKPANILLANPDGQLRRVFLTDFGIARRIDDATGLTATNMTVGTASYAAPEQLKGAPIDGRADQYALACTAFHLLAGSPPYVDSNPAVVISQHVNAPPPSIGARRADLSGLDVVFATAMAKQASARYGSCGEFAARLNGQAIPDFAYARDIESAVQATQPAIGVTVPAWAPPPPVRRGRARVLIPVLLGVLLLIAGGSLAAWEFTKSDKPATGAPAPVAAPTSAKPPPNTGPFTGVFKADFGRVTGVDGQPTGGVPSSTSDTYAVRSACGANGCVATASRVGGDTPMAVQSLVFDQVGGNWVAVAVGPNLCGKASGESWESYTLQPRPDGTFVGEANQFMVVGCANKRPVTFTRTGDIDASSLPDPATLPPRVVSPAEPVRGHYHETDVTPSGFKEQADYAVLTDCLRTGDRCISVFHKPPAAAMVLVFGDGHWVYDREFAGNCTKGGVADVKINVQFPLPQPPQDPIAAITGHGYESVTSGGSNCGSTDVDMKFVRTGD